MTRPLAERIRVTGTLQVALPPGQAFRLFAPRGEQECVDGWEPRFPAEADDDTTPGTVLQTRVHGDPTTWVVIGRDLGRQISYARLTPGSRAGTVTVQLEAAAVGRRVTVTYDLTALDNAANDELRRFADDYPVFLESWQIAIADHLSDIRT
jgi:hypothetical protein